MALSNSERIRQALELANEGLRPFIAREMAAEYGDGWLSIATQGLRDQRAQGPNIEDWDTQALISIILDQWGGVFRNALGPAERTFVFELKDIRNRWAHQESFSTDDTYRALDTINRLLSAISSPEAAEVDRQKSDLIRRRFEEQARWEKRKAASTAIEGQPASGYRPWRELVTPHPDVASGRYQQAEFAADLAQVQRGEGSEEYRDPRQFFDRTYVTEGLRHLLVNALRRLNGEGGDPVVELQTNFGGGKTHSMLALYHLFSGASVNGLPGIEAVVQDADGNGPMKANRAVLVGTAMSPAHVSEKDDGTKVGTMWGELAWQLLGREGYNVLAEADQKGVSPGSTQLKELLELASPCLVLIDEWVAYLRNMYKVDGLPSGSFEANLTFAQALTEAVKAVPRAQVVASVPASQIEIGGEGGKEALDRIKNTFGRIESSWRPASTEESFEIVRRRLFQPMSQDDYPARDAVIKAFGDLYRTQTQEFPSGCREGEYERRMKAAYPIHPELFDRLFTDWSALDRFQRTRGVLRLMAAVIHTLWERQDSSLLIPPSSVPIDAPPVQFELTQYLEDNWVPVIEKDVDGPNSLPLVQDRENPNLGRYSASRRVTRTVFMGSAPTLHSANKGLDDRHIKLGCVQPGEAVATFGDALRRLSDKATHLYVDGNRYWLSTQPTVTRVAQDRGAQYKQHEVFEEVERRLREEATKRGDFVRVHAVPSASGDIPDDTREARLVILGPDHVHARGNDSSPARVSARDILDNRGSSPRTYRNTLVFLAPDRNRLEDLEKAVRQMLAWKSIFDEWEELGLDAFQKNQAQTQSRRAEETVKGRIPETYQWLLVPEQPDPKGQMDWQEIRLTGSDGLAERASKRLRNDDLLLSVYAGTLLRMELDRIPLWRGEEKDRAPLKQLADDFATYLYLPRLRDDDVLLAAVQDGINQISWDPDTFAYADAYDQNADRYLGLKAGEAGSVSITSSSVLVKPKRAAQQLEEDETGGGGAGGAGAGGDGAVAGGSGTEGGTEGGGVVVSPQYRRFYGTAQLSAQRLAGDAMKIAEEVLQHLTAIQGSDVQVTLEIQAEFSDDVPEKTVRDVTENCRTLKFESAGFEKE